jgi:hypothetical protein
METCLNDAKFDGSMYLMSSFFFVINLLYNKIKVRHGYDRLYRRRISLSGICK